MDDEPWEAICDNCYEYYRYDSNHKGAYVFVVRHAQSNRLGYIYPQPCVARLLSQPRRRLRLSLFTIAMLVLGGIVGAITVNATISSNPIAYISPYMCERGVTAYVIVDNSPTPVYYAVAGSGSATNSCGNLVYGGPTNAGGATGTNFATVMNDALGLGGHIILESGTFVLPASTRLTLGVNGEWLDGQGRSSNITTAASYFSDMVVATGNFIRVSNINVDGRYQNHSSAYAGINLEGLNDSALNNFITLTDHCGIDTSTGSNYIITGNNVYNSHDDGICERNNDGTVTGNIVQKTTLHNCYSIVQSGSNVANRITVTGNTCTNSGNFGIAVEGNTATNIVISGNVVTNAALAGIDVFSKSSCTPGFVAANVTISGNTISNDGQYGIQLSGSASANCGMENIDVTGNSIVGVTNVGGVGVGIQMSGTSAPFKNIILDNNIVKQIYGACISSTSGTYTQLSITGNQLTQCGNEGIQLGVNTPTYTNLIINNNNIQNVVSHSIDVLGATNFVISGNTATSPSAGDCVALRATSTEGIISNNSCTGFSNASGTGIFLVASDTYIVVSNNLVTSYGTALKDASSSDFNNFVGNTMQTVSSTVSTVGTHDLITNNLGFNPVAKSTYTACASVCTYTNVDGYDETFDLSAVNGISAWTCNGQTASILLGNVICTVPPGGTMVITWTVTAPTFTKVPLVA